jgi:two-component system KDP operon response regulator KdpE
MTRPIRILVADDAETITTLLMTSLELKGYAVTTARNGVEAHELGMTQPFDLVILDQLMPGLSGLEVIRKWHEQEMNIPVIMLSGVDDEKTVVDSLDLGAVDFVRKPFHLPELMARIRQRLRALEIELAADSEDRSNGSGATADNQDAAQ